MDEIRISIPLQIQVSSKKKFIMNLNQYRNAHYFTLNNAKIEFKNVVTIPKFKATKISINYDIYPKTQRLFDINNVCSIIDKFLCDALVEYGCIEDDDYEHIPNLPTGKVMTVDKDNPRCEATITIINK